MAQKCKKCNRVVNVITKGVCYRCNQVQSRPPSAPEPKIIAVDFDGTLVYNNWPDIGPSKDLVIDYVKQLKEKRLEDYIMDMSHRCTLRTSC